MDKNKIIEAAAKLVAKGSYDKAIKEYQKVLDVDAKDVRVLQKMGEIYQKKNENPQAAQYFIRVADSYASDGFYLKAVAQYKLALKLEPSMIDLNLRLAEVHQQLQLTGEAMAYYQVLANHYEKAQDLNRSLDILKKMVDLDPDNVASRVKLADLYVREGMNKEGIGEFQRAAEYLKRNNRTDDYLRVAERISTLEPDNLALAKELAEAYIQRNDQKRALAKLQVCFKADNRDIDTLRLLAVAFQGLGQTSKTVSVYKELARAYEAKNNTKEANSTWAKVEELDPSDADVVARRAPAPAPAASREPARVAAPVGPPIRQSGLRAAPAAATAAAKPAPRNDPIGKLLTETDVYVKYGLHDKALEHLRKVFSVDPENIDAHEKAYAIYVASNNHQQAFEQLLNVLRLHTRAGDATRGAPYLATILQQNPGHPEVPAFLAALQQQQAPVEQVADDEVADDAILVDSSDDDVIIADENDDVVSAELPISTQEPIYDEPVAAAPEPVQMSESDEQQAARYEADPPPIDASATGEQAAWAADSLDENQDDIGTGSTGISVQRETDFGAPELGDPGENSRATGVEMALSSEPSGSTLSEEFSEPPTTDNAAENDFSSVGEPEAAAEPEPAVEAAAEEQPSYQEESVEAPPEESFGDEAAAQEEAVEVPPEEEQATEEVDEATFFVEQGLYDEAREILETVMIAYPDHQRAAQLLAQVDAAQNGGAPATTEADGTSEEAASPGSTGERDAFDLAAELADELGDVGDPAASAGGGGDDDYQLSAEEVFSEFKKGLEKVVKPEDVDTHYDLGIAYKEMGLIDDAIGEFNVARKGCIGKRKEVDCLMMSGMLHVMRSDFPSAIDAFMQALTSEHARGEPEKAIRYELGSVHELAGNNGKALAQFMKVQTIDGAYRDVAQAVDRLSAVTSPEEEAPMPKASASRPTGRKVGYL